MTRKFEDFSWQSINDGYEVLFYINNKPRRFAFCTHENDANAIVYALKARYPEGIQCLPTEGWQPIETAPKDGTAILVANGDKGGYCTEPFDIGVAHWSNGVEWGSTACCDGVTNFQPTHWMPLPRAPEAALTSINGKEKI